MSLSMPAEEKIQRSLSIAACFQLQDIKRQLSQSDAEASRGLRCSAASHCQRARKEHQCSINCRNDLLGQHYPDKDVSHVCLHESRQQISTFHGHLTYSALIAADRVFQYCFKELICGFIPSGQLTYFRPSRLNICAQSMLMSCAS